MDIEKQFIVDKVLSHNKAYYNLSVVLSNPDLQRQVAEGQELKKTLMARHLSKIAIGGALGTGLLIGTGSALKNAGPGRLFLSYSIIGFLVYIVVTALGELATFIPLADAMGNLWIIF